MTRGRVARRTIVALVGAVLVVGVLTVPAPGASTATGSGAVRTADVTVTAKGAVPATVQLGPKGATVQVDVTFSTSGRALTVEPGATITVGSHYDNMSWVGTQLTHVRGASYRGSVRLPATAELVDTWEVRLDARTRATFDDGPAAWDEVVLDDVKIAAFRVTRPSRVTLGAYRYGTRAVLYGSAEVRAGGYDGHEIGYLIPGSRVRLSFDPAGSARKRLVKTVTVDANSTFRASLPQSRTGTWTAQLVATGAYATATATKKVTVR